MHSLILSTFLIAILAVKAHCLQIIDLPQEPNIIPLNPTSPLIESTLNRVIEEARKGISTPSEKINFATIKEGKDSFSDYLVEKVGQEEADKIAPLFFSNRYFILDTPFVSQAITPSEVVAADPYVLGHISNMLRFGNPGREGTMEEAKKRWNPKTQFLTPEEIFTVVAQDGLYGRYIPFKNFNTYKAAYPEKVATIFSSHYFGVPTEEKEKEQYFSNHSLGFFTQELIKDVYEGAKKIMHYSKQGDNIVIFGNTPYFVGRALSFLISPNPSAPEYRRLIELPFSGSPNRTRENSLPTPKDIVTAGRLAHLKKRLSKLGLSSENGELKNQQTHFVDVVASGSGVAYVIEELLKDFTIAGIPLPHFDIFCMNMINIHNESDKRNSKIAEQNAGDGEEIMLSLPSLEDTHFKIPLRVTYVKGHRSLDMLPSPEWRIFPQYNAVYWQDECDYLLDRDHPRHIKVLLDYFDTNIRSLISRE